MCSTMSNNGNGGRQSGTMGESTRKRLAALVQAANSGAGDAGAAAGARPGSSSAVYVAGFQGSLHGTWGKAATGRSGGASAEHGHNPLLGGQAVRPGAAKVQQRRSEIQAAYHPSTGRVRPASSGAKNVWDLLPPKGSAALLNKRAAQHQQRLASTRPQSAGPRMQGGSKPPAVHIDEYRVKGNGLGQQRSSRMAAPAVAAGFDSGSSFDVSPRAANASAVSFSFAGQAAAGNTAGAVSGSCDRLCTSAAAGAASAAVSDLTEGRLAHLDDAIRDALRSRRSVAEDSKVMLLRLFKEVDDGSGDVQPEEFCAVCAKLNVAVTPAQAAALFKRAGFEGSMPYHKWADKLIKQENRKLAQESAIRKGAFQPGQSANFHGKIVYEECRKPVWTPTNWDPQLVQRSAELPDARLQLEFVYGYSGAQTTGQCLFYNCDGQPTYILAGLGVVYHKPPEHSQHFFLGHSDDVKSLALCPAAVAVGDVQYPAASLAATGQVSSRAAGPMICIWDTRSAAAAPAAGATLASGDPHNQVTKLQLDKELRGIVALGFSPDGSLLAGVATDNSHTVSIWDWRNGWRLVGEGKGCMGEPPQVFGLEWNQHTDLQFATFGKKHLKIWRPAAPGGTWTATQISFGKLPLQNVVSAAFLAPRGPANECILVAGMQDGQAYLFKGTTPLSAIAAHKPGPKSIQPDGQPAFEGLRGMRLCNKGKTLLTGGADSAIMQWDVSDGMMAEGKFSGQSITLKHPYGSDKASMVRSLHCDDSSGSILVGTNDSCIWEVNPAAAATQQVLVAGHAHDVWSIAFHPTNPNIAASVCDGNKLWLWDLQARTLLRSASVGFVARSVAFSAVPYGLPGSLGAVHHIAVGGAQGHIRVVAESDLRPIWEGRDSTQGISEIDYSPDGKLMAAATFDAWIDIYNVEKGYKRIARCSGHSATVRTIDWSLDSSVLQSNCAAREILYWDPRTGKQMPNSCRDVEWCGWTCIYGFPVMGIWPDGADGSDINACDRSNSNKYLVSCDDYGLVKLFNYPVVVECAPHRAYRGHSSHVMCIRFNADDSLVCSTGGKDWAMFQFKLVPLDMSAIAAEATVAAGTPGSSKKGLGEGKVDQGKGDMVWGALDPAGRSFGWVPAGSVQASPVLPPAAGTAAAAPSHAALQQQQQQASQPAAAPAVSSVQPDQQSTQHLLLQQQQPKVMRYGSATAEMDDEVTDEMIEEDDF